MHTRHAVQPQALSSGEIRDLRESLREQALVWARQAPRTFPDGSDLSAGKLLLDLADGATRVIAIGLPDQLWERMTEVSEVLCTMESRTPDPKTLGSLLELRADLVAAALPDAAEAVQASAEVIGRYCAQSLRDSPFLDAAPPGADDR